NYRAQFQKVIQRSSYAGLVSEMRARIADLGVTAPPSPVARPSTPPDAVVAAAPVAASKLSVAPEVALPASAISIARPSSPIVTVAAMPSREATAAETRVASLRVTDPPRAPQRASRYWVQVGAFRTEERAIQVATALRDQ